MSVDETLMCSFQILKVRLGGMLTIYTCLVVFAFLVLSSYYYGIITFLQLEQIILG